MYIPLNAPTGASKADAVAYSGSAHVPSLVTQGVPVLCFVFFWGVQLKSDLVKGKTGAFGNYASWLTTPNPKATGRVH